MYECIECNKLFASIMALTGHKRMHGQSIGKSKKIVCSCLITRKVMPYQNLEQYQKTLIGCKQCNKIFHPTTERKTFCSQSCSATYNNKIYVKRQKKEKPPKTPRAKKIYSEAEIRARNVSSVQAYRQRKYSATPIDVDRKLIQIIYENCPAGYEVDHIIAISEGGPHHQDNLQYLPAIVNRKKNRYQNYDKDSVLRWQDIIVKG